MSLVAGCGDSPTRQAEKEVMKQIDLAERLCARAQAMLGDVLFFVNDQPAPLFKIPDADADSVAVVKLPAGEMADQLNPQAVKALADAQEALRGALKQSVAPKAVLALAHESLARVRTFQGACEEHKANLLRVKIAYAVGQAKNQIPVVNAHLDVQGYVNKLAAGSKDLVAPQIQKILGEIKAEIGKLQEKVKATETEKARLDTLHAKLAQDASDLAAALRDLGQKKALAKSDAKIAIIKDIEVNEIKAEKTTLRTKEAEIALADVKGALATLAVAVKAATARQEMMEGVAGELTAADGTRDRTKKMAANLTDAVIKDVVARVTAVAKDWAELAKIEQAGQVCYDDAAGLLKKARRLAGAAQKGAALWAGEGRALMAGARLNIGALGQQRANAALAAAVKVLWQEISRLEGGQTPEAMPEALTKALGEIETFPSTDAKGKPLTAAGKQAAAAGKYRSAAEAFEMAVNPKNLPKLKNLPDLSWVDRGHQACARYMYAINMYAAVTTEGDPLNADKAETERLRGDALQSLKLAQVEIQEALVGIRQSPSVGILLAVEERLTFGANAFVTVKDVSPSGQMIATDGAANGTFFRELDRGRTTKDLPGTVYVFGADVGQRKAGQVLLLIGRGQYMPAPEGLELTIPAEMTVRNTLYKAKGKVKVLNGGLMPGTS